MKGTERSASEGFVCPNCQTLNNPNAEICISCGVHFNIYDEVKLEISERINDRQTEYLKIVREDTQHKLKEDQKSLQQEFVKKFILLFIVGIFLIPVIWGSLKIIQYQKNARQQFLESNYLAGVDCLSIKDYLCANDSFEKIVSKDKDYLDSSKLLITSKLHIAEDLFENNQISRAIDILNTVILLDAQNTQALSLLNNYHKLLGKEYKDQGNWQRAIDEFSSALVAMPDDFDARSEINEIYSLWIKEEKIKGDILMEWKLQRQLESFNKE